MPGDFEVSFYAVVRGFHVYQAIWTHTVGEAQQEHSNLEDTYAVIITKSGTTIRHITREISRTCWHLIGHDGEITCSVC